MTTTKKIGRPLRYDVDMAQVYALLSSCSIRQTARYLGIPFNTIRYRLDLEARGALNGHSPSPFCVADRTRMRGRKTRHGTAYYFCPNCGESTLYREPRRPINHRRGRPPREIDRQRASDLLQKYSVIEVASMLGVHRNLLYQRIHSTRDELRISGRPFRTWTRYGPAAASHLYWPYLDPSDPRYDGVIRLVNEAVPRALPDHTRADICQEIVVSILTGGVPEGKINEAIRDHLRRHYQMFPVKAYQTLSLDTPLRSNGQGGEERRLIDVLDAQKCQEKLATFRYGDSLADCSTSSDLAERLKDGWEANRLLTRDKKTYGTFKKPNGQNYSDPRYDRFRRTYAFLNNRVQKRQFELESFGGAWSVETALPEEQREDLCA